VTGKELSAERVAYDEALKAYAHASGTLTMHAVKGTTPTEEEVLAEREARSVLQTARRIYLESLAQFSK